MWDRWDGTLAPPIEHPGHFKQQIQLMGGTMG